MKDTIIKDIITAANFKLAGYLDLLEKEAAGKSGISNPMGGSPKSTAVKPVNTAPVMSAAPINDLLPKATTAQSAGLPALTQLPTANQSGVTNNAVLPMMKSSELEPDVQKFNDINDALKEYLGNSLSWLKPNTYDTDIAKSEIAPYYQDYKGNYQVHDDQPNHNSFINSRWY